MSNELTHWGIKGQKWGVRRFQNKDGSLTNAGKKRYGDDESSSNSSKKMSRKERNAAIKAARKTLGKDGNFTKAYTKAEDDYYKATTIKGKMKAEKTLHELDKMGATLNDLARQQTTGEKAAIMIWDAAVLSTSLAAIISATKNS